MQIYYPVSRGSFFYPLESKKTASARRVQIYRKLIYEEKLNSHEIYPITMYPSQTKLGKNIVEISVRSSSGLRRLFYLRLFAPI